MTHQEMRVDREGRLPWRGGFGRIWGSIAVSLLGTQVSLLALPLTALVVLHASPSEVALLAAAGTAPFLVLGLPAGAWVDRWPLRRLMVTADVLRGLLLASVPVGWALGVLSLHPAVRGGFRCRLAERALRRRLLDRPARARPQPADRCGERPARGRSRRRPDVRPRPRRGARAGAHRALRRGGGRGQLPRQRAAAAGPARDTRRRPSHPARAPPAPGDRRPRLLPAASATSDRSHSAPPG